MFEKLKSFISKQLHCPSLWGIFINPCYIAKRELFKEIKTLAHSVSGRILDVGCGQKPYANLFNCDEYTGLEMDTPENRKTTKADLFYDGKHIPADDASFDWVISNEVFEHVFNPDELLVELHRVLKPEGGLLITVPFVWDEHEQPNDYGRYTSFGIKYLVEKCGFRILEQRKTVGDIRIIFQLINAYLLKITLTKNPCINLCICFFLMSPFTIIAELLYKFFPRNNDLYLDNIILARRE